MGERPDPDERKVQFTGGSTYTVSLPKTWASQQGIEPGDPVHLYPRGDRLVLADADEERRRHERRIDASDREPSDLTRTVVAGYVAGCEEIRVEGRLDQRDRRAVRDAVGGLVGIEVHEESDEKIVARTMLDVADLSPDQTLVQMELTTLSMHESAMAAALSADGEEGRRVQQQDDHVDRLFGLICREFQQSLVDVQVARSTEGLTTFDYYSAARQLERIADHAEKIATVAERVDEPPADEVADRLDSLGARSRELVRTAVAGLLDGPEPEELFEVVEQGQAITDDAAALDRDLYALPDGYLLGTILDSVVRTTEYGINVAEAGIQAEMRTRPE